MRHWYGNAIPAPRPRCSCGAELTDDSIRRGWLFCPPCIEHIKRHPERKIKACFWCGKPFFRYRDDLGFCSDLCREMRVIEKYHSPNEKARHIQGWTAWGLEVLHTAWMETTPGLGLVVAVDYVPKQMPMHNLLMVNAKKPAARKAVGSARPPRRDNVATGVAIGSEMAMDYEDDIERAWDRMDEEASKR